MRYFLPLLCCACLTPVSPKPRPDIDSQQDTAVDTESVLPQWSARVLEPSVGSVAGGRAVVLYGEGFRPGMSVQIGANDAEIVSLEEEAIVLTIPPSEVLGVVDVRVALGEKELLLKQAFTYLPDQSGLAIGFGWLGRTDFVGVLSDEDNSARGSGYFGFLKDPTDADARRHMFPMQPGCGTLGPQPAWSFQEGFEDELVLEGDSFLLGLPLSEGGLYFSADIDPAQVVAGAEYGLAPLLHPDGREAESTTFAQLPAEFLFADAGLEGLEWSFRARGELNFGWRGSTGDWMVGEFSLYDVDGNGQLVELGKHYCLAQDQEGEGLFSLSETVFSEWAPGQILVLSLHSIQSLPDAGPFRYEDNNAELRMAGRVTRITALGTQ